MGARAGVRRARATTCSLPSSCPSLARPFGGQRAPSRAPLAQPRPRTAPRIANVRLFQRPGGLPGAGVGRWGRACKHGFFSFACRRSGGRLPAAGGGASSGGGLGVKASCARAAPSPADSFLAVANLLVPSRRGIAFSKGGRPGRAAQKGGPTRRARRAAPAARPRRRPVAVSKAGAVSPPLVTPELTAPV